MTTMTYTGKLVQTSCYCSMAMAIPKDLYDWAQRTGGSVYCPVGHSFIYNDTKVKQLENDLKWYKDHAAALRARADQAEASRRALKGVATKLRKRALEGECPICGQHLRDLQRHVARQHPDEKVEIEVPA